MKRVLLFSLFFSGSFITMAQEHGEYACMASATPGIPVSETYSTGSIATYIGTNFITDIEKICAAYSWITANIKYDTDSMYVINTDKDSLSKITNALRRRKGVCENFAAIFNDIVSKCGIPCYEISGYTKQYGSIDKTGHTWCVVYTDKQWLFCDPTWDVGYNNQAKYFLIRPAAFIESHMPFDPLWQLLDHTVTHKEFYTGNNFSKKGKPYINFTDSLHAYLEMDEPGKLGSALNRMNQAGTPNELVRTRIVYIQMKLGIIRQDIIVKIYNAAAQDFNNANNILNDFIVYRNNKFIPSKTDIEMSTLLLPADDLVIKASQKITDLESIPDNFQYDPEELKSRIDALSARLKEQKDFLKKYLAAIPSERDKLFYK